MSQTLKDLSLEHEAKLSLIHSQQDTPASCAKVVNDLVFSAKDHNFTEPSSDALAQVVSFTATLLI